MRILSVTFVAGALALALAGAFPRPAPAQSQEGPVEKNPGGYDVPELGRSKFLGWLRRDLTRRIPGEETLIKQYADEWGFQFETFSINRVVFAINMDTDGKYPYDITLMDTDCDGVFETKIEEKPGERVDTPLPECVFGPGADPNR